MKTVIVKFISMLAGINAPKQWVVFYKPGHNSPNFRQGQLILQR